MHCYMKYFTYLFLACLIQGCAGARYSYLSLTEDNDDNAVVRIQSGDVIEVLAVGNGFPGWWGYFPGVISSAPDTARIHCEKTRGLIPFRKPGVLFGGVVCRLTATAAGQATLYFGNKHYLSNDHFHRRVDVFIAPNVSSPH